jgi:2-hydroxyglutaryl-CoA dehydratase, D-component
MSVETPALNTSQRRIGYVGHDVPVELILAANALPAAVHAPVGGATSTADLYLEPTFLPASRAIAEQWLTGELDEFDAVVFSRSDDSAQRLYYYLCELQRRDLCGGPRPLMYDIASCNRTSSLAHTEASTRRLAIELGASEQSLPSAIQRLDERTDLLMAALQSTQSQRPARGSFVQRRVRAAYDDWSQGFDQTLQDSRDPLPAQIDAARLMLIGSAPGDERLHEAAEHAGANIVTTLNASTPFRSSTSANSSDPFEQIAHRCHSHPWRAMLQSPETFCKRAEASQVAGAILWILAEDTGLSWVYPRLERALREQGLPVLALTMQQWNVPTATLDAVADFASKIKAPV